MSVGLFRLVGFIDRYDVWWEMGTEWDANPLLSRHHYLGPVKAGGVELIVVGSRTGEVVAAQIWRRPTSRTLPADGTWLELSRWCLTPAAGENAGSRHHKYALKLIRSILPDVTTLVSYSDPSQGHTGALYRACNWTWAPTWLRLRPPPSGHGEWSRGSPQAVKDRWVFAVKKDRERDNVLAIDDSAAIRHWAKTATDAERRWAVKHPQLRNQVNVQ